jgi:hypothetical protein
MEQGPSGPMAVPLCEGHIGYVAMLSAVYYALILSHPGRATVKRRSP